MAVDLTSSFHVALYLVFLESMLFFAVIMQTKNAEPGTHSAIARYFGMVYLFQALSALFLVLSEQFYRGYVSLYCSIATVVAMLIAVSFCIPAAAAVAVPKPDATLPRAIAFALFLALLLVSTFAVSPRLSAAPDIPYLNRLLRRELLGAVVGALVALAAAALSRAVRRPFHGWKGGRILLAGVLLTFAFGVLWAWLEPLCKVANVDDPWPTTCPLSAAFDHNSMIAYLFIVSNILVAEGALRLMAAGSGVVGYADIVSIDDT